MAGEDPLKLHGKEIVFMNSDEFYLQRKDREAKALEWAEKLRALFMEVTDDGYQVTINAPPYQSENKSAGVCVISQDFLLGRRADIAACFGIDRRKS